MDFEIYKSEDRGYVEGGWLKSRHSFSFGDYYNPKRMGFRSLRVINEDWIQGHSGFPLHPHKDMEIFTYVIEGEVTHKDSTGAEGQISAGEIQLMRAGSGIVHSEMNKRSDELHLYQIWIVPNKNGLEPGYEQRKFGSLLQSGEWVEILRPAGSLGDSAAFEIYQNVYVSAKRCLKPEFGHFLKSDIQDIWIQVVKGAIQIKLPSENLDLSAGDAIAIKGTSSFDYEAKQECEILVFAFEKETN